MSNLVERLRDREAILRAFSESPTNPYSLRAFAIKDAELHREGRNLIESQQATINELVEALRQAKDAADAVLAPICASVGKYMIEAKEKDAVAVLADYEVVIPFSDFETLYEATDIEALLSKLKEQSK